MVGLNIRWLFILIGLTSFLLGFLLLFTRNSSRQVPGPLQWALGCFLKGTGIVFFSLYPWPAELANYCIFGLMVFMSNSFFLIGIWKFKGEKPNWIIVIGMPFLSLIINTLFTAVWQSPQIRIMANSALMALFSWILAYQFIKPCPKVYRKIYFVNATAFFFFGLIMGLRALSANKISQTGIMGASEANIMIFAFSAVIQVISTYCYIIMVNIWVSEDLKMQVALRDKFLSIIAHDLKNQINIIGGFSELLYKNASNHKIEKVIHFSGYIRQAAIQTNALLNNLLEWARLKSKKGMFEPEDVRLSPIVRDEMESHSSVAQNKNITIELNDALPDLTVFGDKNMIKTILRNLIINAIKFTNKGGSVLLSISKNEDFAEVSVADSGIGIKPEELTKLFGSEHMHSTEGTDHELGNGLGLLLCKEFVEKHNGKIWAESVFEKGSTFKFTLPLQKQ